MYAKASGYYLKSWVVKEKSYGSCQTSELTMERKLIREYAFKMAELFAKRIAHAKQRKEAQEYLNQLEAKRNFWMKVVHLSSDSDHWDDIRSYIQLLCDPKTSKTQLRALYKSLEKAVSSEAKVSR